MDLESRWLLVTKYLARPQEIYSGSDGAQIESNTDFLAITNSFMIVGYHLSEAFSHQLSLRVQVASTVANSPSFSSAATTPTPGSISIGIATCESPTFGRTVIRRPADTS